MDISSSSDLINLLTYGQVRWFVLFQFLNSQDPHKGAYIVAANSSMLSDNQIGYSPLEAELLALYFAAKACHH